MPSEIFVLYQRHTTTALVGLVPLFKNFRFYSIYYYISKRTLILVALFINTTTNTQQRLAGCEEILQIFRRKPKIINFNFNRFFLSQLAFFR